MGTKIRSRFRVHFNTNIREQVEANSLKHVVENVAGYIGGGGGDLGLGSGFGF